MQTGKQVQNGFISARPSHWGRWFWQGFSSIAIGVCFEKFEIVKPVVADPEKAMLLIGNHIGWWDGFWPIELNRRLWKKAFYIMMLEEQLRPRPLFRRGGAFSIQPGHRSMVQSLAYSSSLLEHKHNLLVMYPQGKIHSLYEWPLHFQGGVARLLQKTARPVQLVFSAALIDFGPHARPSVYYYLQEHDAAAAGGQIAAAYNHFYRRCVEEHRQRNIF
ncbi:MAG: glycerol acyltransferase [Bacteroidetes bacterium]|nr:MAG: glycerol acyltransferase [Bacteroidota bacterium]